jgi:hypothetical protein
MPWQVPTTVFSTKRQTYLFTEEKFELSLPDFRGLIEQNHEETGVFKKEFDPDFDRYIYIEREGGLSFFTIRTEDERHAVGYNMFYLDELIYQMGVTSATQAILYIDKAHRGIGLPFLRFCDDSLREKGVHSIWRQSTSKLDISRIYEKMGYGFIEKVYMKEL